MALPLSSKRSHYKDGLPEQVAQHFDTYQRPFSFDF